MARDHARIHLDIWGNDDFLDLPVDAQMLYFTLWTSEGRSLCGSHEWRPKKLTQRAGDWTVERIEAAAEILSERLFLVIDTDTDECLLRSWIKHDGLWRTPNMAVSVANARGNVASRNLRGVIVFEVLKLRAAEPDSTSWQRDQVKNMLTQKAVDPAGLQPFKGASNPGPNPTVNPISNGAANPYETVTPNPTANPISNGAPTNAIPITTATNRDDDVITDEPPPLETTNRRTPRRPSSAARTVVRQALGNAGYPRTITDRLAVQVDILAHEGHAPNLIHDALREWDTREGCDRPEFLPTVLGDLVKKSRATPGNNGRAPNKLRSIAELAARERAAEDDRNATARKELTP